MTIHRLLPTRSEIEKAAQVVYRTLSPTPQYQWPSLAAHLGTEVWLKHENHNLTGAFKVRGGLVYFDALRQRTGEVQGVITATRGNHGQSVGFAASRNKMAATVVVPFGNSKEKNEAMRALGANVLEHGHDFQAAREHAQQLAKEHGWHLVPAFHRDLVLGVSTYAWELMRAVPQLDVLYVPIGLGSGACGAIAGRAALNHRVEIVGVVSSLAPAYALSFEQRRRVEHPVTTRLADGMACRLPEEEALEILWSGLARVVSVTDEEVGSAMQRLFVATHNVAEGAGAAAFAAAAQERERLRGKTVAAVLSGANVDSDVFAEVIMASKKA
jgi:threonine dehydratase